jgi:hypothetical protein
MLVMHCASLIDETVAGFNHDSKSSRLTTDDTDFADRTDKTHCTKQFQPARPLRRAKNFKHDVTKSLNYQHIRDIGVISAIRGSDLSCCVFRACLNFGDEESGC